MQSQFQPRLRFDRVYFLPSKPAIVKPVFFGLVGIEKVTNTDSFPSDHWGIMTDYQVVSNVSSN